MEPASPWDSVTRVSNTTASLQVVVNPPLRRGSKIHDRVFEALRDLQPDYARFVPWLAYPRLAVAELEPPHERADFVGLFADRSSHHRFSGGHQGPSVGFEFQHHAAMDVDHAKPGDLSGRSGNTGLELHARHRAARPERAGTGRILRASGELVYAGRLRGRIRQTPRIGAPLPGGLVRSAQRTRSRASPRT